MPGNTGERSRSRAPKFGRKQPGVVIAKSGESRLRTFRICRRLHTCWSIAYLWVDLSSQYPTTFAVQGKHAEAESLFKKTQDVFEHCLGQDHPDVATILNNRAVLLETQVRPAIYFHDCLLWCCGYCRTIRYFIFFSSFT